MSDDFTVHTVSSAGDVNGYGIDDLIVSAPFIGRQAGETYVIYDQTGATRARVELTGLCDSR